ncbi:hypothetical protein CAOG_02812 [Capsaspora owczarzaki ATCC 30864]|uniref:Uncharacterized protein n=1 Tax=Capsaspora owczarzaki (strain ATCC 30864) TaxID=595528 RepID=A0A0D2U9H0_CAPO3|nr:hypothetical protein CAOG_02812 [Capsaspora owczarzaki ATCC 30864]KJE91716.1 hypothetical protein CAOG_002812 [Capsaspora owczarzaki ATCC 30864]|eukprot:XP_004348625.1 hypothetical protein CAOG_02812 [Capsaspora owczarzaki ATCC 30864]
MHRSSSSSSSSCVVARVGRGAAVLALATACFAVCSVQAVVNPKLLVAFYPGSTDCSTLGANDTTPMIVTSSTCYPGATESDYWTLIAALDSGTGTYRQFQLLAGCPSGCNAGDCTTNISGAEFSEYCSSTNFASADTASVKVYVVPPPTASAPTRQIQFFSDSHCEDPTTFVNIQSNQLFTCVAASGKRYGLTNVEIVDDDAQIALMMGCNSNCSSCETNYIGQFNHCHTVNSLHFVVTNAAGLLQVPTLFALLATSMLGLFVSKMF